VPALRPFFVYFFQRHLHSIKELSNLGPRLSHVASSQPIDKSHDGIFLSLDTESQAVRVTHTVDVSTELRNSLDDNSLGETVGPDMFEPGTPVRRRMGSNAGCEGDVINVIEPEDLEIVKEHSRASSGAELVKKEKEVPTSPRESRSK
jgi:hypothetical protein